MTQQYKEFEKTAITAKPTSINWVRKCTYFNVDIFFIKKLKKCSEKDIKKCNSSNKGCPYYPVVEFVDQNGIKRTFKQTSFESRKGYAGFSYIFIDKQEESRAEVLYDPNNPNKAVLAKTFYPLNIYGNSLAWNMICALLFILISLALLSFLLIKYLIKIILKTIFINLKIKFWQ